MSDEREVKKDLKTLALFIRIYCENKHADAPRREVRMQTHDVQAIAGRPINLCMECERLLMHAFMKRTRCPMTPKPACKHCPDHCYHPAYRAQIREVMKYSGMKLVLTGRLDLLYNLLF